MENFLSHIGEFGPYQKRMFLLLSLPTIIVAMQKLAWVFLAAKVNYRCQLPWESSEGNYSLSKEVFNVTIPWDAKHNKYDGCKIYSELSEYPLMRLNDTITTCDGRIYDTSKYKTSAVIDHEMVCEDSWKRATVQSLYMIGMLVGSYLFGYLSDKLGRKPIFLFSILLMVVVGIGQAAIPNYYAFVFARLILGSALQGVFLVAYVMGMELVGKNKRVFVGVMAQFFYTLGYFSAAALAYFISDWRWLQIAMTVPALLFIPYYWIVPESTRWLVAKHRGLDAKPILIKAAKVNKKEITDEILDAAIESPTIDKTKSEGSFIDLFRSRNLRLRTINVYFNWFVNSGVYYGLSLNTSNLGGNDYLNFIISGAVELPAHFIVYLTLDRIGRRIPLCGAMIIGGIALLCTMFIPSDLRWLTITLAMIGKMGITGSYNIIYVFTSEMYPTVVRNVAVGSSSMIARMGGALAPFINMLAEYWQPLPLLIFGGLSFAAGIGALFFPETLGKRLPETIEEGENLDMAEKEQRTGLLPTDVKVVIKSSEKDEIKLSTENGIFGNKQNGQVSV